MELITGITGAAAAPKEEVLPEPVAELCPEPVEALSDPEFPPESEPDPTSQEPEPSLEERSYTLVGRALRAVMRTFTPGAWQNVVHMMAESLPARIQLVPSETEWADEKRHRQLAEDLRDQGFTDAGAYYADSMKSKIHLLVNEAYDIRAVVYETEQSGVVLDLVTLFGDGTGVTFVNRPDPHYASSPLHPNVYCGDVPVFELLDACLRERPKKAALPVTPATAAGLMELEYEFGAKRVRGESVNPVEIADAYLEVIEKAPRSTESPEGPATQEQPEPPQWTGRPQHVSSAPDASAEPKTAPSATISE